MNYSNLTIAFQKGRRGTIIAKIMEVPGIMVRATNLTEARDKIHEAILNYRKQLY